MGEPISKSNADFLASNQSNAFEHNFARSQDQTSETVTPVEEKINFWVVLDARVKNDPGIHWISGNHLFKFGPVVSNFFELSHTQLLELPSVFFADFGLVSSEHRSQRVRRPLHKIVILLRGTYKDKKPVASSLQGKHFRLYLLEPPNHNKQTSLLSSAIFKLKLKMKRDTDAEKPFSQQHGHSQDQPHEANKSFNSASQKKSTMNAPLVPNHPSSSPVGTLSPHSQAQQDRATLQLDDVSSNDKPENIPRPDEIKTRKNHESIILHDTGNGNQSYIDLTISPSPNPNENITALSNDKTDNNNTNKHGTSSITSPKYKQPRISSANATSSPTTSSLSPAPSSDYDSSTSSSPSPSGRLPRLQLPEQDTFTFGELSSLIEKRDRFYESTTRRFKKRREQFQSRLAALISQKDALRQRITALEGDLHFARYNASRNLQEAMQLRTRVDALESQNRFLVGNIGVLRQRVEQVAQSMRMRDVPDSH